MRSAILSLSGGLDSTTVLAWLLDAGIQPLCYWFDYGSKHNPFERDAVQNVARYYGVSVTALDLREGFRGLRSNLLLSGGDIPEGHYTDASMSQTVVPGRNLIFLSYAAAVAESTGASHVALGVHQGDHAIYPDCRREFIKAADSVVYLSSGGKVQVLAPFLDGSKVDIVRWGLDHQVPYIFTRTCYKNQSHPCGKCGSCVERLEAFHLNGTHDPVAYA